MGWNIVCLNTVCLIVLLQLNPHNVISVNMFQWLTDYMAN